MCEGAGYRVTSVFGARVAHPGAALIEGLQLCPGLTCLGRHRLVFLRFPSSRGDARGVIRVVTDAYRATRCQGVSSGPLERPRERHQLREVVYSILQGNETLST